MIALNEEKNKLKMKKTALGNIEEALQGDFQDFSKSAGKNSAFKYSQVYFLRCYYRVLSTLQSNRS